MEVSVEETYLDPEELTFRPEGYKKPVMGCFRKMGKARCDGPEACIIEKRTEIQQAYRTIR